MSRNGGLNNAQQQAVLHKEGALLILAGAGAGKTRVITHRIAELIKSGVAPEKILAVTFTNKAAKEMRDRTERLVTENLQLSPYDIPKTRPFMGTFHSLGLEILKTFHQMAGLPRRFTIYDRSDSTRVLKEAIKEAGFDPKELEPRRILSVMGKHKGNAVNLEMFRSDHSSSYIDEAIAEVWEKYERMLKKEKALDFDDILIQALELLKKGALAREHFQNAWDFIHVDEYQDTNRVQYELVHLLSAKHGNIAAVGDTDQCLVAGTLVAMADGSKKSIEYIRKGDLVLSNYGSGRIKPSAVTRARTRTHRGELIRIQTKKKRVLIGTPEHIHFAGYRLSMTPQMYFTYLMHKKGKGWRLGVSKVYTRGQKKPTVGFQQRCNQEHADELWIVGTHQTSQEARVNEHILSLRFQIPTLPFVARKGLSTGGYVHDQSALDTIFDSTNTDVGAKKLLASRGLPLSYPHHRAQANTGARRNLILTLCGDGRKGGPLHRITMSGADDIGRTTLERLGFSVRPAKVGSKSWRFESAYKDYGAARTIAERICRALPETTVIEQARLGGKKKKLRDSCSLRFMPAASILPGMVLFDESGEYDIVETVERTKKNTTKVYDIDVARTHNFIANGIFTHNCIYSWRGASIEHIMNFEKDFPNAKVLVLAENYRSTQTILTAANDAISKNTNRREKELFTKNDAGDKITVTGFTDENEEARYVAKEANYLINYGVKSDSIAVLYRANFQSRVLEEAFLKEGVPYQVLGTKFYERKEVKDALSYLRLALNPDSAADLTRALSSPSRGIGKVTLAKIVNHMEAGLPGAAQKKIHDFRNVVARIAHAIETMKPSDTVRYALKESGLWHLYEKGIAEDAERLENLKEMVTVATKYDHLPPAEGIEKLIEEASLASDQDELEAPKEGVKLMTVHAAKGLEFERVFVAGLEEGLFPHERDESDGVDSEEERRLFYVALTRAQKKVYLTWAMTRRIFGTRSINMPSEFITELSDDLTEVVQFEHSYDTID